MRQDHTAFVETDDWLGVGGGWGWWWWWWGGDGSTVDNVGHLDIKNDIHNTAFCSVIECYIVMLGSLSEC